MGRRAVFLDRDGTIAMEVGYVDRIEKFQLYPFTPKALSILKDLGFSLVLVTNQSGIARGFFTEDLLFRVHDLLEKELRKNGVSLDAIYFCPHHPSITGECNCRKPKTGMLEMARRDLGLDIERSYVIGDKWSDVEMGRRAGAKTIQVLTGYGKGEILNGLHKKYPPDIIAKNILEASLIIKEMEERDDKKGVA